MKQHLHILRITIFLGSFGAMFDNIVNVHVYMFIHSYDSNN
jgi:hypothetical protein